MGAYAAVIPLFVKKLMQHESPVINGDGKYSRDFTHIDNVIQANHLAALVQNPDAINQVYNVALNERTTLNELFELLCELLKLSGRKPLYREFRPGDVLHSQADISLAGSLLGYQPPHRIRDGLKESLAWYLAEQKQKPGTT